MEVKEYLEWLNEDGDFINLRRILQSALDEAHKRLNNYPKVDARIVLNYFAEHSKPKNLLEDTCLSNDNN